MNTKTNGKDLKVKFSGKDEDGFETTWTQYFEQETAEEKVSKVLSENPAAKVVSRKLVDRYE